MSADLLQRLRATWPASTVEAGGHTVEVVRTTVSGADAGLPVLWLPGAQGTAESWCRQLLTFGQQRPMVAVNYPVVGDGPALADLVVAVADALGCERFDLVGTSLGGYIAQWVAVRHADVAGLLAAQQQQTGGGGAALWASVMTSLGGEYAAALAAAPPGALGALPRDPDYML
jgi:pimeloyl-ACP methyl ester carboxylesterase